LHASLSVMLSLGKPVPRNETTAVAVNGRVNAGQAWPCVNTTAEISRRLGRLSLANEVLRR
jgi:hypothetical protein